MPAIGNITIDDATPTSVVFTPRKADPENSIWKKVGYNASNTFSSSDSVLQLGVSPASAKRPTNRTKIEIALPNPSYTAGTDESLSVARFYGTAVVPEDFSEADRGHFTALVQNFLADSSVTSAIVDNEGQY